MMIWYDDNWKNYENKEPFFDICFGERKAKES